MTRDISKLVAEMTLAEKASLTAGADLWSTAAVERLGIPSVFVTDGPNGARGPSLPEFVGGEGESPKAVCVPCGSALGATWDPELVGRVGALLGDEARTKACRVLLAPTVNLHRSPLWGRNFEGYSEDPLLTGVVAAAFIRGAQSQGVATTVKHFAGNESETERMTADSVIDERTLRELYLVPFEMAVRDGGALGVMTGYNRLNGSWGADNEWLLKSVLRDEWGFDGFVISDWYAFGDTASAASAGMDLAMPGPDRWYGSFLQAEVERGEVDESLVDATVTRLLTVLDRVGALDDPPGQVPGSIERPEHRALAREAATAATVLLVNDGVLPLDVGGLRTLAVIGPNAADTAIMGGGSAQLSAHRATSVLDAFTERFGDRVEILHERGVDTTRHLPAIAEGLVTRAGEPGWELELIDGPDLAGEVIERKHRDDTELWFFGPPSPALGATFSIRALGTFTPSVSGAWQVSLSHAGRARLLLDGDVVLDGLSREVPPGPTFLGQGSDEPIVTVEFEAGRKVELVVEFANVSGRMLSGVKVGARPAPPTDLIERAVAAAARADAVVVVVGTNKEWEAEGHDRETMNLPGGQDELIERVLEVHPDAVVVVNAGAPVAMPWTDRARAVVFGWFGGQEMGDAVVDVLVGDAEPAGRLPMTFPVLLEHNPSYGNFPAENGETVYGEGLLMGYRWYDTRSINTMFPFGSGGSYTQFEIGEPALSSRTFVPGSGLTVEAPVTNIGDRRGCEVVQCYVAPIAPRLMRPFKELKAFAKIWLDPGETATVTLDLDDRSFAYWDPGDPDALADPAIDTWMTASRPPTGLPPTPGWVIDPGRYELHIGRSSARANIVHVIEIEIWSEV